MVGETRIQLYDAPSQQDGDQLWFDCEEPSVKEVNTKRKRRIHIQNSIPKTCSVVEMFSQALIMIWPSIKIF